MHIEQFKKLLSEVEKTKRELEAYTRNHVGNYTSGELTQYKHLRNRFEMANMALGNFVFTNAETFEKLVVYKDLV